MSHIDPTLLPKRYQDQIAGQLYPASQKGVDPAAQGHTKARIRQQAGDGLNKTERAFLTYLQALEPMRRVHAQDITLRIGNGCRYTPDFVVDGGALNRPDTDAAFWATLVRAYEVKGFMRDDAAVKLKVAARAYPWICFHLVTKRKGGGWDIQPVLP